TQEHRRYMIHDPGSHVLVIEIHAVRETGEYVEDVGVEDGDDALGAEPYDASEENGEGTKVQRFKMKHENREQQQQSGGDGEPWKISCLDRIGVGDEIGYEHTRDQTVAVRVEREVHACHRVGVAHEQVPGKVVKGRHANAEFGDEKTEQAPATGSGGTLREKQ